MQVALYARVSTVRQADNDLSIPDQLRQMRAWAERHGHIVVKEYIEPGASATDDKRPIFQFMMNDAGLKPSPFQAVVVHSLSRFFRELITGAMYQKTLKKYGVELISITQQTQNDPSGEMQRQIFMLFDEYQSKDISKHTLRGMQENARQGFFNGSKAPYGYQTVDAGQTGLRGRVKKKLTINPAEANVVRDIFDFYVHGKDGLRMGMKEIAKLLNAKGIRMRGNLWRVQAVHLVLSSTTYYGVHVFNKLDSKTRKIKEEAEWVKIAAPAIIEQELFTNATRLRDAWSPKKCVPARENSPNLLMGLLKCGHCGASMSVVTGKSGRYKYYKCNGRMSKGDVACKSKNYSLEKIDALVLDAFKSTIYTADHIRNVIDDLRENLANGKDPDNAKRLKHLEAELKQTEQAQAKLFGAIEQGILELDDQLKERARSHKHTRDRLMTEIGELKRQHNTPLQVLTPQKIELVAKVLARRLSTPTAYSRAYLKATLSEIVITDENLRLSGGRQAMANLVGNDGKLGSKGAVPMIIPEWRPLIDVIRTHFRNDVLNIHDILPPMPG